MAVITDTFLFPVAAMFCEAGGIDWKKDGLLVAMISAKQIPAASTMVPAGEAGSFVAHWLMTNLFGIFLPHYLVTLHAFPVWRRW